MTVLVVHCKRKALYSGRRAPEENKRIEGTRYPSPKKCVELRNNALNVRLRLEAERDGKGGRAESNVKLSLRRPENKGGSEGEVGAQLHN